MLIANQCKTIQGGFKMRKVFAMGLAAVAAVAVAGKVKAFEKPVSYVIPFGPGGESDITARHQ